MTRPDERRAITGLALKWGQLIIALVVYLLTIGVMYGTLRSKTEENAARVKDLEEQTIKRPEHDEMKENFKRQLDRIEKKLDDLRDERH